MMRHASHAPADLLPHAPPMVLLDEVLGWDDDTVATAVTVRSSTPFLVPGLGVPAHIGIEWMAQTCGVFAGLEAKASGQPVRLGFLLGTRRYRSALHYFPEGRHMEIRGKLVFRESGMAVFDCRIGDTTGVEIATARLTTFQPESDDQIPVGRVAP